MAKESFNNFRSGLTDYLFDRPWYGRFRCLLSESEPDESDHILLTKDGRSRIERKGLKGHRFTYLQDFYTTVLELRWRWALLIFFFLHALTYLTFAIIWWTLSYAHGDFSSKDPSSTCIPGLNTFSDFFLFSVETQTTIGYGFVYPSVACGGTLPTLFFQVVIGFLIESVTLGFTFAKLARPKNRTNTIKFSKNACVCQENGQLVLQVRVADLRHTHLIDAQVRGMLVTEYITQEGVVYPLYQTLVDFEINSMGNRAFLMWPIVLTHRITETSPFFQLKQEDLLAKDLEMFVWIDGVIESTGEMCQVRTSYNADEIWWGYRFNHIEEFSDQKNEWYVDFKRFDSIAPCPLLCPAVTDGEMAFEKIGDSHFTSKSKTSQSIEWKSVEIKEIPNTE